MNYEDHFASLHLCEKLKLLGVLQDTLFVWVCIEYADKEPVYAVVLVDNLSRYDKELMRIVCAAYTVGELGYLLPELCSSYCDSDGKWVINPSPLLAVPPIYDAETEANARAILLIVIYETYPGYPETDQFSNDPLFDKIGV